MEEMLREILTEVKAVKAEVLKTNERLDRVESRLDNVEKRLNRVESRLDNIENRLDRVENRLDRVEGQLDENSKFISVLMHRSEELDAKFDGLSVTSASAEAVKEVTMLIHRMAGDITFLVRKAAEHEDDIRKLKLIR